jgi:phosphoglycolate phosphatase
MKKFTTIIFDFDGVIVDTKNFYREIAISLYEEFRQEKPQAKMVKKLMGENVFKIIRELNIPLTKLPSLERRFRQELNAKIDQVKIFRGIKDVLRQIKKTGSTLGVLSSNSQENLNFIFKKNQIDFFDFIYSGTSLFGKSKVLAKLLKAYHLKASQTIYIGDEIRDIQAAKKNKVKVIAVTWGYNKKSLLAKEKPDYFANQPQDIIKILSF